MSNLVLPDESYQIMGACFEVYKRMGGVFLESVYLECLAIEFGLQGIPFQPQPKQELTYRDHKLSTYFVPDFICYGQVIVEIKAVSKITDVFRSQAINYLHAIKLPLSLLINFGHHPKLEYERLAHTIH